MTEAESLVIRQRALEECAQIAKSHRGKAARYRKERGWKLGAMSAEASLEVQAEERGEDIAAMEIYDEIQIQLKKLSSGVEAARSPESLSGNNKVRCDTGEENQPIVHGEDCEKVKHTLDVCYMHDHYDDSPFDVDGVSYCGRCHRVL